MSSSGNPGRFPKTAIDQELYVVSNGGTQALATGRYNIINPAGTIAGVTLVLPSSPNNNDTVEIKFTQIISAITWSGGTAASAPTVSTKGMYLKLVYSTSGAGWY